MSEVLTKIIPGFYYRKLDVEEQIAYKRMGQAVTRMCEAVVIPGGKELPLRKVGQALSFDNPELFYWDYSTIEADAAEIQLSYHYTGKEQVEEAMKQIREEKKNIIEKVTAEVKMPERTGEARDRTVLKAAYQELVGMASFAEEELERQEEVPWIYTLEGALLHKRSVCLGLAQAVNYLSMALHIPAYIITGDARLKGCTLTHAWNKVKLAEQQRENQKENSDPGWYHVDATCEVCEKKDGQQENVWFALEEEEMKEKDHQWSEKTYP